MLPQTLDSSALVSLVLPLNSENSVYLDGNRVAGLFTEGVASSTAFELETTYMTVSPGRCLCAAHFYQCVKRLKVFFVKWMYKSRVLKMLEIGSTLPPHPPICCWIWDFSIIKPLFASLEGPLPSLVVSTVSQTCKGQPPMGNSKIVALFRWLLSAVQIT